MKLIFPAFLGFCALISSLRVDGQIQEKGRNQNDDIDRKSTPAILNGDFQDFSFTSGSCNYNTNFCSNSNTAPFQSSACDYSWGSWWVSHGNPEIYKNGSDYEAVLWSGRYHSNSGDNKIYGEGLFVSCYSFEVGVTYNLTLTLRTCGAFDNVKIDLVGSLPNQRTIDYSVGSSYLIPQPSDVQNVWTATNYSSGSNQQININFVPEKEYTILWIHPVSSASAGSIPRLYLDDVSLNGCQENEVYNNSSNNLPDFTSRSNYIEALNNTKVTNGQNKVFRAGNYITLKPSFEVQLGGEFLAQIGSCDVPIWGCATGNTIAPTSIDSELDNESFLSLYPNPSNGQVSASVSFSSHKKQMTLKVFDLMGRQVFDLNDKDVMEKTYQIDLSKEPSGIYLVHVITPDGIKIEKITLSK